MAPIKAEMLTAAKVLAPLVGAGVGVGDESAFTSAGFVELEVVTSLVVMLPYVAEGNMEEGEIAMACALELAADESPSKKVVVSFTTTEPDMMLLIVTETLLPG